MRYKSEDVKTLDRINRDAEVSNKILTDNEPKQTSYNKEIQRATILERMEVRNNDPYST